MSANVYTTLLHSLGSTIVVSTLGAHAVHHRPILKSVTWYSLARNEELFYTLTLKRTKQQLYSFSAHVNIYHSFTEPCMQLICIYNMVSIEALRLTK